MKNLKKNISGLAIIFLLLNCTCVNAAGDVTGTKKEEKKDIGSTSGYIKIINKQLKISHLFDTTTANFYVDDYVSVTIDSSCFDTIVTKHLDAVRLWIDGYCFTNIKPSYYRTLTKTDCGLVFKLSYDTARSSPWKLYYAYPQYWRNEHEIAPVMVQIGNQKGIFKEYVISKPIKILARVWWMMWVGYSFLIAVLIFIIWKCKGLLRDTSLYQKEGVLFTNENLSRDILITKGMIRRKDLPYSLARTQFLVWLLLVLAAIVHIWVIKDALAAPTGSVLLLLGISGGTMYISKLIDSTPEQGPPADPVAPLAVPPQAAVTAATNFYNNKNNQTQGFMYDILSDGRGISLHRLQLFVFTIFLGFYFLWFLIYNLEMPQFNETLLALMGISNSTYAGVKTTEK